MNPTDELRDALKLMLVDSNIRAFLQENDPMAYKQGLDAVRRVEPTIKVCRRCNTIITDYDVANYGIEQSSTYLSPNFVHADNFICGERKRFKPV